MHNNLKYSIINLSQHYNTYIGIGRYWWTFENSDMSDVFINIKVLLVGFYR